MQKCAIAEAANDLEYDTNGLGDKKIDLKAIFFLSISSKMLQNTTEKLSLAVCGHTRAYKSEEVAS